MGDTCFADPLNPDIFSNDLDFTFDDIYLPSDTDEFLNSLPIPADPASDLDSLLFSPDLDPDHSPDVDGFLNSSSPDSPDPASSHGSGNSENFGNSEEFASSDNIGISGNVENSGDFGNLENLGDFGNLENLKNSGDFGSLGNFENSGDFGNLGEKGNSVKIGKSGDFGNSGVSVLPVSSVTNNVADEVDHTKDSVSGHSGNSLSPNSYLSNESVNSVNDQKIKVKEESNNSALKRKKDSEKSEYSEEKTSKYRKSNYSEGINENLGEDEKRKARLMRNRESAQLSRQRKKHYVEELEDKVRAMHSTINDLNNKISYVMAENATLRQQANGVPPPGMYPHPPIGYPWVPCPSYMMKPQGSQVPLVPIPRLKPQTAKVKRSESKIKKVASVSFLGLFVFLFIFGGLVPMVNLKFREMNESVSGRVDYLNNSASYYRQKGRILTSLKASDRDIEIGNDFVSKGGQNLSEALVASLYVPRNDKLVKIDGNLIIHSIMASERALASRKDDGVKRSEETGLAMANNNNNNNNNVPSIIPLSGRSRHQYRGPVERQRAISGERDKLMSSATDGKLQQWFREGLAGPMLSSGMCTEVFQFDVSPATGAIIPATPVVNASSETQNPKNITNKLMKGRNRRILHGSHIPLARSESNITENPSGIDPERDNLRGNNSLSSMVVSVLVDPREAGDGEADGVMGPKSLSRIFVVVLIDSVKYVTYSCMLPLIGSGAHLVTT